MLKIRSSQIADMVQGDEEAFVRKVLAHVLEECPSRLPTYALRDMVVSGLSRARNHGLRSNEQLLAFVTLMFALAPNFDQQSDLRTMLGSTEFSADERWERIFAPSFDAAWEEVGTAGFYDRKAWFPADRDDLEGETDGF